MWQEHTNGANSFAYCSTFNFIASCGMERHVLLHSNLSGKLIGALEGHLSSVAEVRQSRPRKSGTGNEGPGPLVRAGGAP